MDTKLSRREFLSRGILGGVIFFLTTLFLKDNKCDETPNISQTEAGYYRHLAG
ncbi:MAG: hypothetical protein AB1797_02945 [bacterium]